MTTEHQSYRTLMITNLLTAETLMLFIAIQLVMFRNLCCWRLQFGVICCQLSKWCSVTVDKDLVMLKWMFRSLVCWRMLCSSTWATFGLTQDASDERVQTSLGAQVGQPIWDKFVAACFEVPKGNAVAQRSTAVVNLAYKQQLSFASELYNLLFHYKHLYNAWCRTCWQTWNESDVTWDESGRLSKTG